MNDFSGSFIDHKTVSIIQNKYLPYWLASAFFVIDLFIRPLLPIDETRYVAVAWEMWLRGDFLVPYLNGEPYSHKPPLFFWLMHLGWLLFGVNDWTPRLIAPAFSLLSMALMGRLAGLLWPGRPAIPQLSQFILFGFFFWAISSTLTMFDVMLSFFVLLGIYLLYAIAVRGLTWGRWLMLAMTVALGILGKGPVVLLHLLFIVLMAPLWQRDLPKRMTWVTWYGAIFGALLLGIGLALCWALPAAYYGGEDYGRAILWGQTSGRIVKSFAHQLPWWWYFKLMPLLLLPWILWPPVWRGFVNVKPLDGGIKFCLYWIVPVILVFCLISGKRVHYLLPLFPAIALLLARLIDRLSEEAEGWQKYHRVLFWLIVVFALAGLVFAGMNEIYDWLPILHALSPLWLLVLLGVAVGLARKPANSLLEATAKLSLLTAVVSLTIAGGYFQVAGERHDVSDTSRVLAGIQQQGGKILYKGKYHGEYHFAARLRQPIQPINSIAEWEASYPGTYLIIRFDRKLPEIAGKLLFRHADRGQNVAIFRHPSLS